MSLHHGVGFMLWRMGYGFMNPNPKFIPFGVYKFYFKKQDLQNHHVESGLKYYVDNCQNQVMAIWHFIILFCMLCTYLKCSNTNSFKNLTVAIQVTADEGLNEESSIEVKQAELSLLPRWLGTETEPVWEVKERGKFRFQITQNRKVFSYSWFP